ncbi:UNVERIFIED_CONTAM: hypothetical protein RMT77_005557 [Armadillidium vulgare]
MMLLLIHFSIVLCGGDSQKICSDSYCKVDSCQSRIAASTVWNVVIKNKNEGRICWRKNLCVWKLHPNSCKEIPFEKQEDIDRSPCHDMDKEERYRLRQLGIMKLSKYPHYQEIKSILPFCGIGFIVIILLMWLYEQVEECLKIKYANFTSSTRISNTIVRFDNCDSCIVGEKMETSSGVAIGNSQKSVLASNKIDDSLIAIGYKHLREKSLKNQRNQEMPHANQSPELSFPKLVLETKRPVSSEIDIPVESKDQLQQLRHSQKRKRIKGRKHNKKSYDRHLNNNKRKGKNTKNNFSKKHCKSNPKNPTDKIFCCCTRNTNTTLKNKHEPKTRPETKNDHLYSQPKNKHLSHKGKTYHPSDSANHLTKTDERRSDIDNKYTNRKNTLSESNTLPISETNAETTPKYTNRKNTLSKSSTLPIRETNAETTPKYTNRKNTLSESSTLPIRERNAETTPKSISDEVQRNEPQEPTNSSKNEEEEEKKVLSSLPYTSVDSTDLGFKALTKACRIIRAFQYA